MFKLFRHMAPTPACGLAVVVSNGPRWRSQGEIVKSLEIALILFFMVWDWEGGVACSLRKIAWTGRVARYSAVVVREVIVMNSNRMSSLGGSVGQLAGLAGGAVG